ncbi:hypothetical protein F4808DRAFT_455692 [Astrocystis sublimbata]|nr:hypothetical protein F4808DRAFT_455692 [Astrocystis sublimbata]
MAAATIGGHLVARIDIQGGTSIAEAPRSTSIITRMTRNIVSMTTDLTTTGILTRMTRNIVSTTRHLTNLREPPKTQRVFGAYDPAPMPPNAPPLPANREEIFCEACETHHDPRFCLHIIRGALHVCVRCGQKGHLFERCWHGDRNVDDRDWFLYQPRQGLAPVRTSCDCTDIIAEPHLHVRDVLLRDQARAIYNNAANPLDRKRLNFIRSKTVPEVQSAALLTPATPQTSRGPPPNIKHRANDIVLKGRPRTDISHRVQHQETIGANFFGPGQGQDPMGRSSARNDGQRMLGTNLAVIKCESPEACEQAALSAGSPAVKVEPASP